MTNITVNGELQRFEGDVVCLADLLARLKLNAPYFAVAVNDKVIPRSEREKVTVTDGDKIEIIHAVGGG